MTETQTTTQSLPAFLSDDGRQYLVWCSHCFYFHRHGSSCEGHRSAHCEDRHGPYSSTGYRLVRHGDFDRLYGLLTAAGFTEAQVKTAMGWRSTSAPKSKLRLAMNDFFTAYNSKKGKS